MQIRPETGMIIGYDGGRRISLLLPWAGQPLCGPMPAPRRGTKELLTERKNPVARFGLRGPDVKRASTVRGVAVTSAPGAAAMHTRMQSARKNAGAWSASSPRRYQCAMVCTSGA